MNVSFTQSKEYGFGLTIVTNLFSICDCGLKVKNYHLWRIYKQVTGA